MAYLQYNNYYKQMVLSGKLPYPYYYPYINPIPGISNPGLENLFFQNLLNDTCYNYNPSYCKNEEINESYNAYCNQFHNLSFIKRNPNDIKYDYCYYDFIPYQDPSCVMGFTVQKLTSNIQSLAKNLDTNLLDSWGIIIVNDIIWVANSGSGLITGYDLTGKSLMPVINVFGFIGNITQPTGLGHNNNTRAFPIISGPITEASTILISTRDGTVHGYSFMIDPDNSRLLLDNSVKNSVYTGLVIVNVYSCDGALKTILYITDFYNQSIDVYDCDFNKIIDYHFIDEFFEDPIPEDFSPFNIVNIGDLLYVLYAKQNPVDNQYELPGSGNGYINIFNLSGNFIKRFASRGILNTPWGLVLAPTWFGYPSGSIIVGNFGDGTINIFDADGKYLGKLNDKFNNNIYIEGLRGLITNPNYDKILYWTCSASNLKDAYMGSINTLC